MWVQRVGSMGGGDVPCTSMAPGSLRAYLSGVFECAFEHCGACPLPCLCALHSGVLWCLLRLAHLSVMCWRKKAYALGTLSRSSSGLMTSLGRQMRWLGPGLLGPGLSLANRQGR